MAVINEEIKHATQQWLKCYSVTTFNKFLYHTLTHTKSPSHRYIQISSSLFRKQTHGVFYRAHGKPALCLATYVLVAEVDVSRRLIFAEHFILL